jgi:hypothetical protein
MCVKEEIQVTLQTETRWGFGIFLVVTFLMALYGLCLGLTVFLAPHLVIGLPWLVSWYIVEIIIGILIVLHFAFYMYLLFRDSEDSLQAFLGIFLGIAGFFVLGAGISALTEKNIATYSSVAFVMICLSMVLDVVLMIRNKE